MDDNDTFVRERIRRNLPIAARRAQRLIEAIETLFDDLDASRQWSRAWKSRATTWRPIARKALEVLRHERAAHHAYKLHAEALTREHDELQSQLDAAAVTIAALERRLAEAQQAVWVMEEDITSGNGPSHT